MNRRRRLSRVAGFTAALSAGCTAGPGVTIRPRGDGPPMRQTFDRAYVSRTGDIGEDRVVLVDAPIDRPLVDHPGEPIQPQSAPPLHTVLLIRLHWRPVSGTLRSAAGLNAVLHYYVWGPAGSAGGPPSLLHYIGTGFVTISDGNDGADVRVSQGSLSLKERYGDLRDPLGTFAVDGSFHAVRSEPRVSETATDIKIATQRAAAAFGPSTTRP